MNRFQSPVVQLPGLTVTVNINYDGDWNESDARVIIERLGETIQRETKYLQAQGKGAAPAREPRNPCGCGGAGS